MTVAPEKKPAAKPALAPAAKKASKITKAVKVTEALKAPKVPNPISLLKKAYQKIASHEDGWVLLTQLGQSLHQIDAEFKPNKYGHSTLGKLVRAYPDLFEVKGNNANVYIKLKA